MFEVLVKEVAKKQLEHISVEVIEKKKNINGAFRTRLQPSEGIYKKPILDASDQNKGLTFEQRNLIAKETGWSREIINSIDNMDQYAIYKNAGLHEATIDGRKCLIKDIDMNYVDPKTGLTNRELMELGRSPYDAKTGERIELHHMGQKFDGPFAELCENSEHGDGNDGILHPNRENSWRNDEALDKQYQLERKSHWMNRV